VTSFVVEETGPSETGCFPLRHQSATSLCRLFSKDYQLFLRTEQVAQLTPYSSAKLFNICL
ncbi:hypothetical protein NPIL_182441, partial [Nephila pilipes]